MRISTKLHLGFGILLGLMMALGGLIAYDMIRVQTGLFRLSNEQIPAMTSDVQVARLFLTETQEEHRYLMDREPFRLSRARSADLLMNGQLRAAVLTSPDPEDRRLQEISVKLGQYHSRALYCVRLARSGKPAVALSVWERDVSPLSELINGELDRLSELRSTTTSQSASDAIDQSQHLRVTSEFLVLFALLAAAIAAGSITRSLLRPLQALVKGVNRLGRGDLSARVDWTQNDEFGTLAEAFNHMADQVQATINKLNGVQAMLEQRNEDLGKAYGLLQKEMELASRVQREILPSETEFLGIRTAAHMTAASDIGGDFYDVVRLDNDRVGFVIGDVSGKGIPAALMMVFVVTLLREICRRESSPSEILTILNRLMLRRFGSQEEMYSTCFLGVLERSTLQFSYAKAGHEEPLWYHARTGRCVHLSCPGLFLGLFQDGRYERRTIQLSPGDRLVFYTDGVVDARDSAGASFGHERLAEIVVGAGSSDPSMLVETVKETVSAWTGSLLLRDDVTLLVAEIPVDGAPLVPESVTV